MNAGKKLLLVNIQNRVQDLETLLNGLYEILNTHNAYQDAFRAVCVQEGKAYKLNTLQHHIQILDKIWHIVHSLHSGLPRPKEYNEYIVNEGGRTLFQPYTNGNFVESAPHDSSHNMITRPWFWMMNCVDIELLVKFCRIVCLNHTIDIAKLPSGDIDDEGEDLNVLELMNTIILKAMQLKQHINDNREDLEEWSSAQFGS